MLLTLELAIILPAASLMAFSIWNLRHIQRDKAIEAAIQRDFSFVLNIAEKKTWMKASELLTPVRKEFPCPEEGVQNQAQLDRMLADHPEFLYAILYDKDDDLSIWRSQPAATRTKLSASGWRTKLPLPTSGFRSRRPIWSTSCAWRSKKRKCPSASMAVGWITKMSIPTRALRTSFLPKRPRIASPLGVVGFDPEYLRNTFFPAVMTDVLTSKSNLLRADAIRLP